LEKLPLLEKEQLQPFLVQIDNNKISGDLNAFLETDVLVICVPYGQQKNNIKAYQELAQAVAFSPINKVVFISSTSVYAACNSAVSESENTPLNPDKHGLVALENLFLQHPNFQTNVLRFSGLIGGTRNPGDFFKEGRVVQNGLAPINLIHLDDCVGILCKMLKGSHWGEVFNAAADSHPTRKEFYTAAALKLGKKPAVFMENLDFSYKTVSSKKIKTHFDYSFIHADLMDLLS
jgi:nucleoside-diphosphate-sugar epimerase